MGCKSPPRTARTELFRSLGRTSRFARYERIYAIGDIHGCLDLLTQLLRRIEADLKSRLKPQATLVILGDFIDRGPASRGVLQLLRVAQMSNPSIVVIRGNHEELLLKALAGHAQSQRMWLASGGYSTLRSFGADPTGLASMPAPELAGLLGEVIGQDIAKWLSSLPATYRSGDYFFCHAGVRPGRPLHKQVDRDLLWIRDPFLQSNEDFGAIVVHGHSAAGVAEVRPNRINVDTAAFRTGRLTAVGLEGTARWIVTSASG